MRDQPGASRLESGFDETGTRQSGVAMSVVVIVSVLETQQLLPRPGARPNYVWLE